MFLCAVFCNIEEGKAAKLNGFVSFYKKLPQLRMVKGKLGSWWNWEKLKLWQWSTNRLEERGEAKILYAQRLIFKLYLSVCSGGSTSPGKAAARQQDLGLIIRKADLPLGEVGTGLHPASSCFSCLHSIQGSYWGLCFAQQAALTAGASVWQVRLEWKGTCVSSPEILVK